MICVMKQGIGGNARLKERGMMRAVRATFSKIKRDGMGTPLPQILARESRTHALLQMH
jgi:hypothetical protein